MARSLIQYMHSGGAARAASERDFVSDDPAAAWAEEVQPDAMMALLTRSAFDSALYSNHLDLSAVRAALLAVGKHVAARITPAEDAAWFVAWIDRTSVASFTQSDWREFNLRCDGTRKRRLGDDPSALYVCTMALVDLRRAESLGCWGSGLSFLAAQCQEFVGLASGVLAYRVEYHLETLSAISSGTPRTPSASGAEARYSARGAIIADVLRAALPWEQVEPHVDRAVALEASWHTRSDVASRPEAT